MGDRPILFSTLMVRALVDGRKTQSRRSTLDRRGNPTVWRRLADDWARGEWDHRLWVREAFRRTGNGIVFRADDDVGSGPWNPSIHLPRAASRLTLAVTGIAVERLQDISDADARREGAVGIADFENIWISIHGARSWRCNPEVVVLSFDVQHRNIDRH